MSSNSEVLALIPARSSSTRIRHQNIRPFRGKPLLAHSILHALSTATVSRVVVSTDSAEYAAIARAFGADVPFLRPPALASDSSTELDVLRQALRWLDEHEGFRPEVCVYLRPTFPNRSPADIDGAVRLLLTRPDADSVRSISPKPPERRALWQRGSDGLLVRSEEPRGPRPEASHPASRIEIFEENGVVDVVRSGVVRRRSSMTGDLVLGLVTGSSVEIRDWFDFERALSEFPGEEDPASSATFVFDLDGVIAKLVPTNRYQEALPDPEMISIVNRLYDDGNRIILHTARGTVTGIDWRAITEDQLREWGLRYHELHFGKPAGDFYVDDRNLSVGSVLSRFRAEPS